MLLPARFSPAAATSTAATWAPATAAATTAPLRLRACLIDGQSSAVQVGAVQRLNCFICFLVVRHLDERKTARPGCLAVTNQVHTLHLSILAEDPGKVLLGCTE
jgi:hypothetical protein